MILVITRKTYDAVVALSDSPPKHGDASLTRDIAIVRVPDVLGNALAEIHPRSENAIQILLGEL